MTVYLCGDLHGSVQAVKNVIAQIQEPTEDDIIVVCGDAGLEYGNQVMGSAKKAMNKFPGSWLILRGNHDVRYWRDHCSIRKDGGLIPLDKWHFEEKYNNFVLVQDKYPNIHYIDDLGGIYTLEGYNCLMIPGAYSVDKAYRISHGLPYEPQEQLSYSEWCKLDDIVARHKNEIDFVVAHTFPAYMSKQLEYLFLNSIDQSTVDKNTEQWISSIMCNHLLKSPRFKKYFGGHYHDGKCLDRQHIILYRRVRKLEDYVG